MRKESAGAPRGSADPTGVANTLSGTVHGHSLQAGTIRGDVFIGAGAAPHARLVPQQLPRPPRHFTDRTDSLEVLDRLREPSASSTAVISGPAGIGKTSLALRWMDEHKSDWPEGQLYVDLRGHHSHDPVSPNMVLPQFLRALGVPSEQIPADLAEQAALYRTVIADRRIAVLCDNALSAAQVRPLMPASESSICLVTSRWHLTSLLLDGAQLVLLNPLDTDSAVELLSQIAGRERVAADRRAARAMVLASGCFPLAVAVGAALLLTRPEWTLASAAAGLKALGSAGPNEEVSMSASLDQSYAGLPENVTRLYRRLSLHPGSVFSREVARAVAATAPAVGRVDDSLAVLVDANLLATPDPEHFRFHDVIQQHALGRADTDETAEQRQESIARIAECYLRRANAADEVLYPQRRRLSTIYMYRGDTEVGVADAAAALAWFDRERGNLIAVQRMAADQGLDETTWQMAEAMWALFIHLRYHNDWISSHALGVAAAARCRNPLAEARLRTGLGIALRDVGQYEEALREFDTALYLRRQIDDRRGEGLVLYNVGITHQQRGDWQLARVTLQTALAIREETNDARGVARVHSALGEVESLAGHHDAALAHLTQAQNVLTGSGDPYEAMTERLLGQAHMRSGALTTAHTHLAAALATLEVAGETFEAGAVLEALGELAEHEGDSVSARVHYARAEAVYSRLHATHATQRVTKRIHRLGSDEDR